MTRDDIIKLADKQGLIDYLDLDGDSVGLLMLVTLCQDVAAAERDYLLSTEIHSCHANCQRFACVQTRKAVEAEREACAQVCDEQSQLQLDERVMRGIDVCAAAIRARK